MTATLEAPRSLHPYSRALPRSLRDQMADLVGAWPVVNLPLTEMDRLRHAVRRIMEDYVDAGQPADCAELAAVLHVWPEGVVKRGRLHHDATEQARAAYDRWWAIKTAEVEADPSLRILRRRH